MKEHLRPKRCPRVGWLLVVALLGAWTTAWAQSPRYIQGDVRISAQSLAATRQGGSDVLVARGGFQLTLERRVLKAGEAVIWIRTWKNTNRRDVTIYLRGKAQVMEPGGTTSGDRVMVVTLHHQGRLRAEGQMHAPTVEDDTLLTEALRARQAGGEPTTQPTRPAPAATQPTQPTPRPTKPPKPVSWRADKVEMEEVATGQHRVIARGNVYLAQGSLVSEQFLELRSQVAVLFTRVLPKDDPRRPYAPRLTGMPLEGGKEERIAGVYLEGDVMISRGERFLRAPRAYYDFTTNRAIAVDAVFRTVQEQRDIPIYVRAKEARALSVNEWFFREAKVSTSDFHSPTYHVGASKAYFRDDTAYDATGVRVSERSYYAQIWNSTFNVRSVPILYWPYTEGDFEEGHTALRKVSAGSMGDLGWGVQSEWNLFRLLGLVRPEGVKARLDLEAYTEGYVAGIDMRYSRQRDRRQYSGYWKFYGVLDEQEQDDFGKIRKDIPAARNRGRILMRHKEFLAEDFELQFELSYICDRNFLERYFPREFHNGKEQETLLYAKKQEDFWAATSLIQGRLNRFQTEGESWPELGLHVINPPLPGDAVSVFSESHAGLKRNRPANFTKRTDSDVYGRVDTRNEVDLPLALGPLKVVPFVAGRATHWGEMRDGVEANRLWGQAGVKAATHVWRVFPDVQNRFWDIDKLRHIVTPYGVAWVSCDGGVHPTEPFALDPSMENRLGGLDGARLGVAQRLQTKRGPPGKQHSVDWMRLDVTASFYDSDHNLPREPANGRTFMFRPEYGVPRDHVNAEYTWNISDATSLLSDMNWDLVGDGVRRANVGFAVQRDPRLRYYLGWRFIRDLNASVGTAGLRYQINRKYSVSVFEQYDFAFTDGVSLATNVTFTRKFPRWFGAVTFSYDQREEDVVVLVSFWPEGIPEVRIGGDRLSLFGSSDEN